MSTLIVLLVPIFWVNNGESMTVCADRPRTELAVCTRVMEMAARATLIALTIEQQEEEFMTSKKTFFFLNF